MGGYLLAAPGLGTAGPLADLLGRLARRYAVHAHDPGLGPPAAVLTRPGRPWPAGAARTPTAWWVEHPNELPSAIPSRVRLLLTWRPVVEAVPLAGWPRSAPVEVVPAPSVDGTAWRPVAPFVRARWRRRFGLPDRMVAVVGTVGAPAMDERTAADALFLCAAAVVGPAHVLRALALGTPTVCDAATAELIGAVDGVHVVVAGPDEAVAAADDLAGDPVRAALLGRAGRRLVEARHDVAACARRVAAALQLPAAGPPPVARVADVLEAMGTPVDAPVVARVTAAVGTLGDRGFDAAVAGVRW